MDRLNLTPDMLLRAYEIGVFPMAEDRDDPELFWVDPQRAEMTEIHMLDPADQSQLMTEITRASRALETLHTPDKINVAALGNMVPQLHIHIVARFRTDAAWPGPIWGAHPPVPYAAAELDAALEALRQALN